MRAFDTEREEFIFSRASDMTTVGMSLLVLVVFLFAVILCYVAWKAWRGDPQ